MLISQVTSSDGALMGVLLHTQEWMIGRDLVPALGEDLGGGKFLQGAQDIEKGMPPRSLRGADLLWLLLLPLGLLLLVRLLLGLAVLVGLGLLVLTALLRLLILRELLLLAPLLLGLAVLVGLGLLVLMALLWLLILWGLRLLA